MSRFRCFYRDTEDILSGYDVLPHRCGRFSTSKTNCLLGIQTRVKVAFWSGPNPTQPDCLLRGACAGRNWREPHERGGGFDRDFSERGGRFYDDFDRDRERGSRGGGFDRPRTYSRSRSYDDEGDLPEWSTADADDLECLGTFDSSGAFMSMKVRAGVLWLTRVRFLAEDCLQWLNFVKQAWVSQLRC